jgi:hypothetical protein
VGSTVASVLLGISPAAGGADHPSPATTAGEASTTAGEAATIHEARGRKAAVDSVTVAPISNDRDSQPMMGLQSPSPDSTDAPDLTGLDSGAAGSARGDSEEQPGGGAEGAVSGEDDQVEGRSIGMVCGAKMC